jgi:HAT1-interacting factor 1
MESKLTSRSEPTPNTETEIKVPQEDTAPVAATTAEKGKAPVDKTAIEENANNLIAKGGKSMALKAWEEAVSYFGEALENMYVALLNCLWQSMPSRRKRSLSLTARREIYDEFDARMAPVLLSYGKALFELGFSQQGVMGKEEVTKTADAGMSPSFLFREESNLL